MATATYPPPPPYYRLYKDYLQDPKSAPEPPPPVEGTYVCFGGSYTVRISLSSHASFRILITHLFIDLWCKKEIIWWNCWILRQGMQCWQIIKILISNPKKCWTLSFLRKKLLILRHLNFVRKFSFQWLCFWIFIYYFFIGRLMTCFQAWKNRVWDSYTQKDKMLVGVPLPWF